MKKLKNILKEPLFHFFIIGFFIYMVYGLFNPNEDENSNVILVTAGEIQWLEANWTKQWNRPPTPLEKTGIVNQLVREKALYKAAIEMGLDKEDVIIRRRMVQKIEFLTSDIITPPTPRKGELENYFKENIKQYKPPDAITISQIFFDPDKRGEKTLDDAELALRELITLGEPKEDLGYGDRFMLQIYYPDRSESELSKLFGNEFAQAVFSLKQAEWHGPILSGYGTHVVYVHRLDQSRAPDFTEVVELVKKDWEEMKLQELNEIYIQGIMSRYEIIVENGEERSDG